jgi:hypothetical protein
MTKNCQNLECRKLFIPRNINQKVCSKACRRAEFVRTYQSHNPKTALTSGTVGAIGELLVGADLLARGYEVFRALSPACSCDLAILRDGVLLAVEVRTGYRGKSGKVSWQRRGLSDEVQWAVLLVNREGEREIVYDPPLSSGASGRLV